MGRLTSCTSHLKKWTRETFGNVGHEICMLEQQLSATNVGFRRRLLGDIRESRVKEENL